MTPIVVVASALNANVVQIPVIAKRNTASNQSALYGVEINNNVTNGLYFLSRSCRVKSHSNVAVDKC